MCYNGLIRTHGMEDGRRRMDDGGWRMDDSFTDTTWFKTPTRTDKMEFIKARC